MEKMYFFGDVDLIFKILKDSASEEQVYSTISFDFKGKEDFVQFYKVHNGIYFPKGAEMKRSLFYTVKENDSNTLEVEHFYQIGTGDIMERMWEATKKHSPEARVFAETHFPFARDAGGNEFFIEANTGLIKYISWEYGILEGEILAAPSFKEFCLAIKAWVPPVMS